MLPTGAGSSKILLLPRCPRCPCCRGQVVEVDAEPMPLGPDNPHGIGFITRETLLETEQQVLRGQERAVGLESADRDGVCAACMRWQAHACGPMSEWQACGAEWESRLSNTPLLRGLACCCAGAAHVGPHALAQLEGGWVGGRAGRRRHRAGPRAG